MSDEPQRYGMRKVVPYNEASEALEIHLRRVVRDILTAIKDADMRPDWDNFRLEVYPSNKGGLYIPRSLEIMAEVTGEPT